MNRVVCYALITLLMGSGQSAFAQRHGRHRFEQHYYAPAVAAVQETPVAPAPAPPATEAIAQVTPAAPAQTPKITPVPGAAPSTGVSCCEGSSTGGHCTPECKKGLNLPEVKTTGECHGTEKCTPIEVHVNGYLPEYPGDLLKFYKHCYVVTAIVPVPVIEVKQVERCDFKKYTYKVGYDKDHKCCEVTVCVPCQSCLVDTKVCVIKDLPEKVQICERQDGSFDVYVLDAPGMPQKWLLYVSITKAEVAALKVQP